MASPVPLLPRPLLLLFSLLLLLLRRPDPAGGGPVSVEFVRPNFTASNLLYVDTSGVFLQSPAAVFQAVIASPGPQQPGNFYFSVVHIPTNTIVWSANRDAPVSDSVELVLSPAGLALSLPGGGGPAWSTPGLHGAVSAMRLADTGNLLLLDGTNTTLWQSFNHPTDTLLSGQALPVGAELVSTTSDSNFTEGDYRLLVTDGDAVLRWNRADQQYWSLSTDARVVKDTNAAASYLAMNATGFYLFGGSGDQVVWQTTSLPAAGLRIGKLDNRGRFTILSYAFPNSSAYIDEEFVAPANDCDLPFSCLALGLCTPGQNTSFCSCAPGFGFASGGCQPADGSILASASACTDTPSYVSLRSGIGYFANKFARATVSGGDFTECQSLCSQNCSCLGFYYTNSSGSCFLLKSQLGSFSVRPSGDASTDLGFVKVVPSSTPAPKKGKGNWAANVLPILLPSISVLLLVLLAVIFTRCRRRRRRLRKSSRHSAKDIKLGRHKSWPSTRSEEDEDEEEISIPGLPTRFSYEELLAATEGFRTRIGSGGFGDVYKGVLPDKTTVAVKRISNIGVQGKREFCTEIAVIGNIHHVNLVKLRGFCVQGSRRLLVYEFMSRGSLDRSLFALAGSPVLEWGERVEIALGTARGLAYLHGGCDHKIIHCDVKPENILLNDHAQVKISDFGLSKLLAPEQSALFTTMRGTRGYLAPEWLTNSAISDRTDVYSYGMVLLEIVRGRKNCVVVGPTDDSDLAIAAAATASSGGGASALSGSSSPSAPAARVYFPMHALEMHEQGMYLELADPRLEGRVEAAGVEKVVRVALCCLHEEPALRPSMAAVVGMLEGTMPVPAPRTESLNFLRFYGRGFEAQPGAMMVMAAMGGGGGGGRDAAAVGHGGFYGRGKYGGASTTSTGSTTTSTSQSYISAHQLSGPR